MTIYGRFILFVDVKIVARYMQGSGWVGYGERWEDIPSGCLRVSFGLIKKKSSRKLGIFCPFFFISERFAVLLLDDFKTILGK